MVFLSAFTTKAAVFTRCWSGFPGAEQMLVPIGLYMVFYGIIYALLGERHAAHPGVLDREPGGFHGLRA